MALDLDVILLVMTGINREECVYYNTDLPYLYAVCLI